MGRRTKSLRSPVLDCTEKNLVGGFGVFVSDIIREEVFWPFWLMLPGLGPSS